MSRPPNQLHLQLAQRILTHIRSSGLQPGHHLTEQSLQQLLGTSRAPIRVALAHLAKLRLLRHQPNKGYFLARAFNRKNLADATLPVTDDERIYFSVASERLAGRLPDVISENEMMRRFGLSRHRLRKILDRIAMEGWAERRSGNGWAFLPMIDSPAAYRENYELRRILEPAGIRSATFVLNRPAIERLQEQQDYLSTEGYQKLGQLELFQANALFHETIAAMSENRFLYQTIVRQNQLRRLIEYRQTLERDRVRRQTLEHLKILKLLSDGKQEAAAQMMERHLGGAEDEKVKQQFFDSLPPARAG